MAFGSAPVSIQGALLDTLKTQGLGHILYESRLRNQWTELTGEKAAHIAELDSLKEGVLSIKVADAAWRNELHYQRETLRKRANQILGVNVVKDVRLR